MIYLGIYRLIFKHGRLEYKDLLHFEIEDPANR